MGVSTKTDGRHVAAALLVTPKAGNRNVDKLRYTHRIENTAPQETAWINLKMGTEQKMPGTEGHRVRDSI